MLDACAHRTGFSACSLVHYNLRCELHVVVSVRALCHCVSSDHRPARPPLLRISLRSRGEDGERALPGGRAAREQGPAQLHTNQVVLSRLVSLDQADAGRDCGGGGLFLGYGQTADNALGMSWQEGLWGPTMPRTRSHGTCKLWPFADFESEIKLDTIRGDLQILDQFCARAWFSAEGRYESIK
jgi:hypothetical protein